MRYYTSTALNTSIALPESSRMRVLPSFKQISEEEYLKLTTVADAVAVEEVEEELEEELDSYEEEDTEDDEDSDILSSMIDDDDDDSDEDDSEPTITLDDSVVKQEEKVSANEFESIKTLRDQADKTKEARVTKGKAHGVYAYQEEAWVKVGEL